jgi:hypothetical protein
MEILAHNLLLYTSVCPSKPFEQLNYYERKQLHCVIYDFSVLPSNCANNAQFIHSFIQMQNVNGQIVCERNKNNKKNYQRNKVGRMNKQLIYSFLKCLLSGATNERFRSSSR